MGNSINGKQLQSKKHAPEISFGTIIIYCRDENTGIKIRQDERVQGIKGDIQNLK